jgi:hypothetical protein
MATEVVKKGSSEIDMSQFRHKRNIKFLDKWFFGAFVNLTENNFKNQIF